MAERHKSKSLNCVFMALVGRRINGTEFQNSGRLVLLNFEAIFERKHFQPSIAFVIHLHI